MPQILLRLETALPLLKARLLPDGVTLDNAAQDGIIDVKLCICQVVSSVLDNWREAVSQMVFSTFAGVLKADEGAVIAPTSSGVVSSIVQNVAHAGEIHLSLLHMAPALPDPRCASSGTPVRYACCPGCVAQNRAIHRRRESL